MASGMPDFQRIFRPRFGAANLEAASVEVVANDETEIITLAGKGMIYGGALSVPWTSAQHNSVPVLEVDGEVIAAQNFFSANFFSIVLPNTLAIYLLRYDSTKFRYVVGISPGITFDESVRVLYKEEHGTTPTVVCSVVYALI